MIHYLVVANQTLGGSVLSEAIEERLARSPSSFHVVVPATPTDDLYDRVVAAYAGDLPDPEEEAEQAQRRLDAVLTKLRAAGAEVSGGVGDPDPLVAITDALADHPVDEIILSTLPPGISRWLSLDLVHRVERSVDVPVTHVQGPAAPRGAVIRGS